jgi:polysaccharide biosynthesis protein PelC
MKESISLFATPKSVYPGRASRATACCWLVLLAVSSAMMTSCARIDGGPITAFEAHGNYSKLRQADAPWAVLPIENHTETVNAGQRAASIVTSFLYSQGFKNVRQYPAPGGDDALFEASNGDELAKAKQWAQHSKLHYALAGAVNEWRYKVGVDGEPAIGIALQVIDLDTDTVIWTGMASKTGWSRDAASAVAQDLVKQLLVPVVGPATSRSSS